MGSNPTLSAQFFTKPRITGKVAPDPNLFEKALNQAFRAVEELEGDIARVPHHHQTVVCVHAAQGIIDNGGLQYFFEADFPGRPDYSLFVNSYCAIGAGDQADALQRALSLFPFADPHLYCDQRNKTLEELEIEFEALSDQICGHESVWSKLRAFINRHQSHYASD